MLPLETPTTVLGGHFGPPKKKYLAPPPPQIPRRHPPDPSPPGAPWETPHPRLGYSTKKNRPLPWLSPRTPPSPPPSRKRKIFSKCPPSFFLPDIVRDRKGTPKNFCDKDFAELSGELSGLLCLKTLVLMGKDRKPHEFVQKNLWRCSCDFLALGFFFGSRYQAFF